MALWFCLFCALLLPLVKSQRFKTTTPNEFFGSPLTCTESECDIICSTSAGCKGATIDASQSQLLRVTCAYMQSCQYITITSAASISTQINCTAPDSCNGAQLNVANSASSSINCNATVICFILIHIALFLSFSTYSRKESWIIAFVLFSNPPLGSLATSTYQYNSTIGGARMPRADNGMSLGLNPHDGTILL
eukprot:1025794_1